MDALPFFFVYADVSFFFLFQILLRVLFLLYWWFCIGFCSPVAVFWKKSSEGGKEKKKDQYTVNNRVLRLPAIVLLNTTFRPGNSWIAGRRRTLLLTVKPARMSVKNLIHCFTDGKKTYTRRLSVAVLENTMIHHNKKKSGCVCWWVGTLSDWYYRSAAVNDFFFTNILAGFTFDYWKKKTLLLDVIFSLQVEIAFFSKFKQIDTTLLQWCQSYIMSKELLHHISSKFLMSLNDFLSHISLNLVLKLSQTLQFLQQRDGLIDLLTLFWRS